MAPPRSQLPALLLALLTAAASGRLALAQTCAAGYFWDSETLWCMPCGNGRFCAGGAAPRVTCPWTTGTVTPTASALSGCVPVSCNPCGVPAAGLYEPRDVVYSTGSGASPPNSLFVQLGEEGGLSASVHFVCSFGSLGTGVGIGDVAMIHTGDILVLFTTGAFKLLPAASLAALKAGSGPNGLDVASRRCSSAGAIDLPAATALPAVAGETWGGLTTGLWSNVVYASRNQGTVCSFEFSGSGASLMRSTTAFVCRSCSTASQPRCGASNTGTDITAGADGHLYLWSGADAFKGFQGYRLQVDAASGHLDRTAPMILTNQGIRDASGNQTDRAFTNAAAACVDGGSVLGLAMRTSNNQGAAWRFGDQFAGSVTRAVATPYALRTFSPSLQSSFKFNGAATRTLCVGSTYCDTCNATGTATCSDHGCVCKEEFVGLDCGVLAANCSEPPPALANATWACASGTPHRGACNATCVAGFAGAAMSKCYNGSYSNPLGGCAPARCSGPPPALANATWACASGTPHGANCSATCAAGFDGSPTAACAYGSYSDPVGSCEPAGCSEPPITAVANATWACPSGTPHGANCSATCAAGFAGSPKAACAYGSYSDPVGSCEPAGCSGPPLTAVANATWTCAGGTAHGANCSAACATGFDGSPTAACAYGSYAAPVGSCTDRCVSMSCAGEAACLQAAACIAGTCQPAVSKANGAFCVAYGRPGTCSAGACVSAGGAAVESSSNRAELTRQPGRGLTLAWRRSAPPIEPAGTWTDVPNGDTAARSFFGAAILSGGDVLVAGGYSGSIYINSTSRYSPTRNNFTAAATMSGSRGQHTTTAFDAGRRVLVAGGVSSFTIIGSAEVYNATSDTWTSTENNMTSPRRDHAAVLISGGSKDGSVLVVGGTSNGVDTLASADLFNGGSFKPTGNLSTARRLFTATSLPGGKVLVVGGSFVSSTLASAEIWQDGTFTTVANMTSTRVYHTATAVRGGRAVLVVGGQRNTSGTSATNTAELFDVAAGTWSSAGMLATVRRYHAATLLHDGTVLVCGGLHGFGSPVSASCEAWHPDAPTTWVSFPALATARQYHTAVTLGTGHALVLDGVSSGGVSKSVELFSLSSGSDPCASCQAETACVKAAQCIAGECQPAVNKADGLACNVQEEAGSCSQGACVVAP